MYLLKKFKNLTKFKKHLQAMHSILIAD